MSEEKHESIESVERVLDSIQKLPSMPSVVMEILDSFSNENLNINTLATKVSSDLVIAARVLRVANSSFFGLSHQIGSISEAISILGFNNLRGIVTAASVINVFSSTENGLDMQAFWRHSIATAVYAKVLAKQIGLNSETAFTAGLLHDIGKLVMSVYFPMTFARVNISEIRSTSDSLQAEKTAFGLDHAEIGGEVAKRWNFPVEIRDAISLHHTENNADEENVLVHVIYVANLFANALQNGGIRDEYADALLAAVNVRLKINRDQLEALAKEAQQLYDGAVMLIAPN
jgi:putative nucleotidyltransferase with HDIG domain